MLNLFRFIAAIMVAMAVSSLLFMESWFTWRIWVVLSVFFGLIYIMFCIHQDNLQTLGKSIISSMSEVIRHFDGTLTVKKTKK